MTRRILITPKASQDIDKLFEYIAQNNHDAALRFFDATRQTIAKLAAIPGKGSLFEVDNSRLVGLRKWAVKGFEKHLIFYLYDEERLTVIRIIHASRDLPNILGKE
ncbi:MAG: type II toxin-antitoxin system RelE/ParE family toxin [Pseudomonadota bacterium]|nr:type II toxin-antitoxin system RelE/ParE family toxin [Pseudomonadota bacterium]